MKLARRSRMGNPKEPTASVRPVRYLLARPQRISVQTVLRNVRRRPRPAIGPPGIPGHETKAQPHFWLFFFLALTMHAPQQLRPASSYPRSPRHSSDAAAMFRQNQSSPTQPQPLIPLPPLLCPSPPPSLSLGLPC